jgi:hypothetical protein
MSASAPKLSRARRWRSFRLRFVWAVAAFVLAAVLIGAGIAQRTVFVGAETTETEISTEDALPYTLIEGAVLTSTPGSQTMIATADSGPVYAAYGRTADVTAWLSDVSYTRVTLDDAGEIVTELVEPELVEPEPTAPETDEPATGAEGDTADDGASTDASTETPPDATTGRNPAGSDLWLDEFTDEGTLTAQLQLPDTMSVLLASDGTAPAPETIELSWPLDNSTPWAGPLIVAGGILMVLGVLLYLLGIRHARRSRGPRRKGIPQPATQPLDTIPAGDAEAKGVISSGTPSRRALRGGTRGFIVIPSLALAGLLFTGCTAASWPQLAPSATPSPTASVLDADQQDAPAVTETQAKRILAKVAQTVSEADVAADGDRRAQGELSHPQQSGGSPRARGHPHRAAADLAAAGQRRLATNDHDGCRRRGRDDRGAHRRRADAERPLVRIQADLLGEPRGIRRVPWRRRSLHDRRGARPARLPVPAARAAGVGRGLRGRHRQRRQQLLLIAVRGGG